MVVEDDNILSKAIVAALKKAGLSADAAYDGEEALGKMKKNPPRAVLLDLILPKLSGEDVLAAMKLDSKLQNVPVLVATVKDDKDSISRCVKLGARGYFIKAHYTLDEIIKQVEKVIAENK